MEELSIPEGAYSEYVSLLRDIFGTVGERVADATFLSLASWKIQDDEIMQQLKLGRIRQHILLYWEKGWAKSTMLTFIKERLLPSWVRTKLGTEGSIAALRGSVSKGKLFIPRMALADVYVVPELASWLNPAGGGEGRESVKMLGVLNVALEEGMIEVDLIKFASLDFEEIQRAREYGIEITETGTMRYRTKFVFWAATHSVDFIPRSMRDAFLSRFMVIKIPRTELTNELAINMVFNPKRIPDERIESVKYELAKFLMELKIKIDLLERAAKTSKEVLLGVIKRGLRISPRVANYIRVIGVLYSHIMPEADDELIKRLLERKLMEIRFSTLTMEEIILEFCKQPRTIKEIQEVTGLSRATVYYYIRKLPIQPMQDKRSKVIKYVTRAGWGEGFTFSE